MPASLPTSASRANQKSRPGAAQRQRSGVRREAASLPQTLPPRRQPTHSTAIHPKSFPESATKFPEYPIFLHHFQEQSENDRFSRIHAKNRHSHRIIPQLKIEALFFEASFCKKFCQN